MWVTQKVSFKFSLSNQGLSLSTGTVTSKWHCGYPHTNLSWSRSVSGDEAHLKNLCLCFSTVSWSKDTGWSWTVAAWTSSFDTVLLHNYPTPHCGSAKMTIVVLHMCRVSFLLKLGLPEHTGLLFKVPHLCCFLSWVCHYFSCCCSQQSVRWNPCSDGVDTCHCHRTTERLLSHVHCTDSHGTARGKSRPMH